MSSGVTLTAHTVRVDGGFAAGFLVRAKASRRDLGKVWPVPGGWRWRSPDGSLFREGDAPTQDAAIDNLWDDDDTNRPSFTLPPARPDFVLSAPAAPVSPARKVPAPKTEAPLVAKVVWSDDAAGDLTGAVAASLGRNLRRS